MFDNSSYDNIKNFVQSELNKIDNFISCRENISADFDYSMAEYFSAPSKKIRSVLAILFFKALGFDICDSFIKLLSAVEIIHNATLIHDDVIDKSDLRRGIETFNSKFDNSLAVIAGDYLLSRALRLLLSLDNYNILNIFSDTIEKMCVGEISQYFNKFKLLSIDDYIEKSRSKTAVLFCAAFESASILYGFNRSLAFDFANNFGIAFQIRDDILNFVEFENKPAANDYADGIYTAPVIFAEGNIENISIGIEKAKQLLDNYLCCCHNILAGIEFNDNIYKNALLNLLELLKL
ncbi:polyprenyl synthetase family protein [bacterium]|nr:polyprenyl synthetase family protein [bacterium]